MNMNDWGYIKPETVAAYISFERNRTDWSYNPEDNSIYAVQAEGVAGIWNLLNEQKLAILADEVGMGKTMQALGVCALLWRIKQNARVIILAPNHSVAQNWENEYKTFIESHYKIDDNLVRAEVGRSAIYKPVLCGNLEDLKSAAQRQWCHFLIGKISSLSYVGTGDTEKDWNAKIEMTREKGKELRKEILKNFGTVDLLIIDEAQYFRNKDGGSLRVNTAMGLFGEKGERLADRVLLMTATPNHSGNNDIKNIVSYFNKPMSDLQPNEILSRIGIRRFRRLAEKTKYQYRSEAGVPCNFKDDHLGELFFGLYQKELVNIAKNEKRTFMYGYLEGFESTGRADGSVGLQIGSKQVEQEEIEDETTADSRTQKTNDYKRAADSVLLHELAAEYKEYTPYAFPAHPKYMAVTSRVVPDADKFWIPGTVGNGLTKSLIFVRRIPSVRELTARINATYDNIFLGKIYDALGVTEKEEKPVRENYDRIVSGCIRTENNDEEEAPGEDEDTAEGADPEFEALELNSQVFDLFRTKADGTNQRNTHASLFRNRFTKDDDPFSLFFQPPPDYKRQGYTEIYRLEGDRKRSGYLSSALDARLLANKAIQDLLTREKKISKEPQSVEPIFTLWSIFYDRIGEEEREILGKKLDAYQKEAFARFLQQGVLRASPGLIEIYCWFIQAQKEGKAGLELYRSFVEIVKNHLENSLLFEMIQRTVRQFSIYAEKICGIFSKEDLVKREWTMFNRQSPCYSCAGSTSNRQRLIQGFNSPFFPNVLVSTSVLQEGVNLQYNCDNIYHYGIAWTPGDNEQRVGRIDRLFSKTERKLKKNNNAATLDIFYPYLDNTFDRDQVAAFIKQKYLSEKTLDKCIIPEIDKEIAADVSASVKNWEQYLRSPVKAVQKYDDPYPPKTDGVVESYKKQRNAAPTSLKKYWAYLQTTLTGILNNSFAGYMTFGADLQDYEFPLYELKLINGRTQPLKIKLSFSSVFSGLITGTVYWLSFTTPLTRSDEKIDTIVKAYQKVEKRFPLARICRDKTTKTHYRLYMQSDLPLFVDAGSDNFNIHEIEMKAAIMDLVYCADIVEEEALGGQDLKIAAVINREGRYDDTVKRPACSPLPEPASSAIVPYKTEIKKALKCFWDVNHSFPFIKVQPGRDSTIISLPFCEEDFDAKEQTLLKRWFDYVVEEIRNSKFQ